MLACQHVLIGRKHKLKEFHQASSSCHHGYLYHNFMTIHLIVVKKFSQVPKMSTGWWLQKESHGIKVIWNMGMNFCTNLHGIKYLLRDFSLDQSSGQKTENRWKAIEDEPCWISKYPIYTCHAALTTRRSHSHFTDNKKSLNPQSLHIISKWILCTFILGGHRRHLLHCTAWVSSVSMMCVFQCSWVMTLKRRGVQRCANRLNRKIICFFF